jgi:hypothetical protein
MSKDQGRLDYTHFEQKILEKVNSHRDGSKDTNCQKKRERSIH